MLHRAGRRQHHAIGAVAAGLEARHLLSGQAPDDLRPPENGTSDALIRKGGFLKVIEDDVVRRILRLPDLLQHDLAFAFQFAGLEQGVLEDIPDQLDTERQVLRQDLRVVGGDLAPGIGVELAADRLDLLGNGLGVAGRRALEQHVLEQMRHAVFLRHFMTGADPDPDPQGDRKRIGHGVGGDRQAVGEPRNLDGHAASVSTRAWSRMKSFTPASSAGITMNLSGLWRRSASRGGKSGRRPMARSTASGNFAGCAVARVTIGIAGSPRRARAAARPTAVWGSITSPQAP